MAKSPLGCKNRKLLLSAIFIVFLLLLTQPAFASYGGGGGGGGGGSDPPLNPPVNDPDPPLPPDEPDIPEEPIVPIEKYTVTVETNVVAKVYMDGSYECKTERFFLCLWCDYTCEIDGVEEGRYVFKAKADGFEDDSDSEYISGDETVSLDLDEVVESADSIEIDYINSPSSVEKGKNFIVKTELDNVYYKWNWWLLTYEAEVDVKVTFDGKSKTETYTDSCTTPGACGLIGFYKWLISSIMGYDMVVKQDFTANNLGTYTIYVKATDEMSDTSDTSTKSIKVIKPRHDVTFDTNTEAEIYADGDYLCTTDRFWPWGSYDCEAEIIGGTYDFVAEPTSSKFESDSKRKTITSDTEISFSLDLKTFDILVLSNVPGARVYLDKSYQGKTIAMTPSFIIEDLVPDCYKVRVDKIGYIEEPAKEVCLTSSDKSVKIYLYKLPSIIINGDNDFDQDECSDFSFDIRDADGYDYSYEVHPKNRRIDDFVIKSGSGRVTSDRFNKDVTVCSKSTYPDGKWIFSVTIDGITKMEKSYDFTINNLKPEIDIYTRTKYKSCEITEGSFTCEEKEVYNPEYIYGGSKLYIEYDLKNFVHQCTDYSCSTDNSFNGNLKFDFPDPMWSKSQALYGSKEYFTTIEGNLYPPPIEVHKMVNGDGITVTIKDYDDSDTVTKTFAKRFLPNPDPSITDIGLCYIMPDDEGNCDERIELSTPNSYSQDRIDECENWRLQHPNIECPYGNQFNLDPIARERPVALYFKAGDFHKFGKSLGYVQLTIDDKPATMLGQGEDLVNGILINESDDVDKPLIWIFNVSSGGWHTLTISVTDMQDADNTEKKISLYIEQSTVSDVHTPFDFASGELKDVYPFIAELEGMIFNLTEELEHLSVGSAEYNETLETLAFVNILYSMANTREAIVLTGGAMEAVGSWMEQIGGALTGFGKWIASVPGHIYDALATFASDPLGTLAGIGAWIADNPWQALEIAISVAAIVLLCLTLVGAVGGVIALAGCLVMDALTIGVLAHKALVLGQPLDTLDYVTMALVIGGNVGVGLRVIRPAVKNARLQAMVDRTIRIAEMDGLSKAFGKMKNRLGGMFGKLRGVPGAEIRAFEDSVERLGTKAFGSTWRDKMTRIFSKVGNIRFIRGVSDDVAEALLKLADDLDAAVFNKLLNKPKITSHYLDNILELRAGGLTQSEISGLLDLPVFRGLVRGRSGIVIDTKALTTEQARSLLKLKSKILEQSNKYGVKFNQIFHDSFTPGAGNLVGDLHLNLDDIGNVIARRTVEHEFSHMSISKARFGDDVEAYSKFMDDFYSKNKWLPEAEANMLMKNVNGNAQFSERISVMIDDIDGIRIPDATPTQIENIISIERLAQRTGNQALMSRSENIIKELIANNKITLKNYNSIAGIFDNALSGIESNGVQGILSRTNLEQNILQIRNILGG